MINILKLKEIKSKYLNYLLYLSTALYLSFFLVFPVKEHLGDTGLALRKNSVMIIVIFTLLILSTFYFFIINNLQNFSIKKILYCAVLINLLCLFIKPITSTDFYTYFSSFRLISEFHQNPYLVPYDVFSHDTFYSSIKTVWSKYPQGYGPVFFILGSVFTFIGSANLTLSIFLLKGFFVFANIANCYLIFKITKNKLATALYSLNPLIIFEFAINSHNDVLTIFFILLGLYFIKDSNFSIKNQILVYFFLTLSFLIKFLSILVLPIIFLSIFKNKSTTYDKILATLIPVCVFFGTTIICYLPFWTKAIFTASNNAPSSILFSSPFVFLSSVLLTLINIKVQVPETTNIIASIGKILFITFYSFISYKILFNFSKKPFNDIISYSCLALGLFFFLCLSWFMPWYLCNIIAFFSLGVIIKDKTIVKKIPLAIYSLTIFGILFYTILR